MKRGPKPKVPSTDGKKLCCRCKQRIPLCDYSPNPRATTGVMSACRACSSNYRRERYRNNPATRKQQIFNSQDWAKRNPSAFSAIQRRYYFSLTGREVPERKPKAAVVDGQKECTSCHVWLPVGAFHPRRNVATGLQSWCDPCVAAYARKSYGRKRRAEALPDAQVDNPHE